MAMVRAPSSRPMASRPPAIRLRRGIRCICLPFRLDAQALSGAQAPMADPAHVVAGGIRIFERRVEIRAAIMGPIYVGAVEVGAGELRIVDVCTAGDAGGNPDR